MASTADKYDVIVIGSGTAGYTAAGRGAQLGLKTAQIEHENPDGIRGNWNRLLNIQLLHSARLLEGMRQAENYGITCEKPTPDWNEIVRQALAEAEATQTNRARALKKVNVEDIKRRASLSGLGQVTVSTGNTSRKMEAHNIILATGVLQENLPGLEFDNQHIISMSDASPIMELPKSLLIVGGGIEGVESAYLYATMGCKVTLIEQAASILPLMDADVADAVAHGLERAGVTTHTGSKAAIESRKGKHWTYKVDGNGAGVIVEAELCLITIGIKANVEDLDIGKVGLELVDGLITANRYGRTSAPGVWAVGHCTGGQLQTHAAAKEGICAVETIANLPNPGVNRDNIPICVHSNPQVASVGMSEQAAKESGHEILVGKASFGLAPHNESNVFIKFIVGKHYHEVLGVHIVGIGAPELIAEVVLGRMLEVSAREFATTIHAHSTRSETIMHAAANALGEPYIW